MVGEDVDSLITICWDLPSCEDTFCPCCYGTGDTVIF